MTKLYKISSKTILLLLTSENTSVENLKEGRKKLIREQNAGKKLDSYDVKQHVLICDEIVSSKEITQ